MGHEGSPFPTACHRLPPPGPLVCPALIGGSDSFVWISVSLILHILIGPFGFLFGKLPFLPWLWCHYSHDALLEVAVEGVRLMVLDLSVLHRAAPQVVVQLCGVDSRAGLLILGGVLPDPEVDVLGEEAARSPRLGCPERSGQGPAHCPPPHCRRTNAVYGGSWPARGSSGPLSSRQCPCADLLRGPSSGSPDSSCIWGELAAYCSPTAGRPVRIFSKWSCGLTLCGFALLHSAADTLPTCPALSASLTWDIASSAGMSTLRRGLVFTWPASMPL